MMGKYEEHFIAKHNVINGGARFHHCSKAEGEMGGVFFWRHMYEAKETYNFGATRKERIRDRFVIGIKNTEISQWLQTQNDLTLRVTIDMARHSEMMKQQNSTTCTEWMNIYKMAANHSGRLHERTLEKGLSSGEEK